MKFSNFEREDKTRVKFAILHAKNVLQIMVLSFFTMFTYYFKLITQLLFLVEIRGNSKSIFADLVCSSDCRNSDILLSCLSIKDVINVGGEGREKSKKGQRFANRDHSG